MFINKGAELIRICKERSISIAEYTLEIEQEENGHSREELLLKMQKNLQVMRESAEEALLRPMQSVSGMTGGDAYKLHEYSKRQTLCGDLVVLAMARALSCSEVNVAMGKIVAAPTAGPCGVIPGAILTAAEKLQKSDEEIILSLFTASAIGILIAKNATLSGAEGGCQAECGSAAAMAAAAIVEMMGGSPEMALHAAAIALKNILGLVCDPIAGLVESPCAKRNASGAINALISADLAMAGITSIIPFDEVVDAMFSVGRALPCELRETGLGGIAATPTGQALKKKIFG
ncbi:MAG: L-serine ammonia-lyase, iron-sulfur-dependent, subunit alpha [Oligoflexia bacterium]|nr:L-serine ammonia-lyase, iron-sulfur-dependent, subunit alpha [Oligoflexia bacterium]